MRKGKNMQVPVKDLKEKMTPAIPIPKLPDHIVGLDAPLEEVKGILLKHWVQVVVISAPGGCGHHKWASCIVL
ncbi:hypothetical protein LguiB_006644 [Lonicera macranthoides]